MNYKKWFKIFIIEIGFVFVIIAACNIIIDPFFHYHKPLSGLFYVLDNQRYQNNGIVRHFDYNAIITGSSMTENFKTSEFNNIFNAKSIKVSSSGATFKEINDNLKTAYRNNHQIKYIVRGLDINYILRDKDSMRKELGQYPIYLYNYILLDDLKYIFNKDVIKYSLKTLSFLMQGKKGGVTSFDEYANWNAKYKFGREYVLNARTGFKGSGKIERLTSREKEIIKANIKQNVTDLANAHPETTFYYFFPPYSIAHWGELYEQGTLQKNVEIEKYAIELILKCPNIKLFSFNTMVDITIDLRNYRDTTHYGEWINSQMLIYMKNNIGLLTKENYKKYIEEEKVLYLNYPYNELFKTI